MSCAEEREREQQPVSGGKQQGGRGGSVWTGAPYLHARTLRDEDVDVVVLVEDRAQARRLLLEVDRHLRHVDRVDVEARLRDADHREERALLEALAVLGRGRRGEPAAVAAHDLVHDHHLGVGGGLGADVLKEHGALLGGGPCTERLRDRIHVVVDRLRKADDCQVVALLCEEGGEIRGRRVGVVASNGVQHLDAILDELVRRHALRVLALLDEAALDAVLDVGQLDARVANRRPTVHVEGRGGGADARRDENRLAEEQALVPVRVADYLHRRVLHRVLGYQRAHRRREARRQAASGEHGDLLGWVQDVSVLAAHLRDARRVDHIGGL